jgi:hypothetical protein
MSYVPLASFAGLTLGDYGLWKWSLAGNHQVLAVVFGLTLPPLAVAFLWVLVLGAMRTLSALTRRPPEPAPPWRAGTTGPLVVRLRRRVTGLRPRVVLVRRPVVRLRPRVTRIVPRSAVKPRVRARTRGSRVPAQAAAGGRSPEHPPGKLAA